MKKAVAVAAAVAALVPASALAKEATKLEVCGASGCAAITDRSTLRRIGEGSNGETLAPTPRLQRYYRLTYTIKAERAMTFTTFYLPRGRLTRGVDERGYAQWFPVSAEFARALATLRVKPFPKPTPTRVLIGGREVADPASYTRLLSLSASEAPLNAATDWQAVVFTFRRSNPWSSDATVLEFSPGTGYLYRDGRTFDLPNGLARKISARKSLSSGGGVNLAYAFGGGLVGAAVVLGALAVARRRRV